jgi:hypothetical protein
MSKKDKKNRDLPQSVLEGEKPGRFAKQVLNVFQNKNSCKKWLFLIAIFAAIAMFASILIYKNKNSVSPFKNRIFQALSLEELPFFERRSFFFPAASNNPDIAKVPEKKQIIEEAGSMKASKSEDWWLNSGGIMYVGPEEFTTNIGSLPEDSAWRKLYAKTNPKDTDNGYFPQNIFRLVTRSQWKNFSQSVYFNIKNINLSDSSNRNESNGVLLFNRYQDGKDLYYTGVRVDGDLVIKKKNGGKYYTLAEKSFFSNGNDFDVNDNPNLIPLNSWIGIKSQVENTSDGGVDIKLFLDKEGNGDWQLGLEAEDKPNKNGTSPFLDEGYAGIRTDFMDVIFKSYDIQKR